MMTWHIELACDGSFGKEQGVRNLWGEKRKLWKIVDVYSQRWEFWDKLLGPDILIDMFLPQEWMFDIGN